MAFFVVQRDADSALSIPLPDAYPTREAAIAALSAATASGSLVLKGEVFIADLSTAVPVLVMQAAPAAAVAEAPIPAEAEPGVLDEAAADAVYAPPLLGDEQSLAAALKRAATSLEEEGIIAPASIESEPSDVEAVEESAAETGGESAATEERPWEWANVEAYEAPADLAVEVEPAVESEPPVEVESAVEVQSSVEAGTAVETEEAEPEGDPTAEADEPDAELVPEPLEEPAEESVSVALAEPAFEDATVPEDSLPEVTGPGEAALDEALADLAGPGDEGETSSYVEAPIADLSEALVGEPETESVAAEDDLVASLDSELYELTGAALTEPAGDDSPIITSAPADGEDAYVPRPVILGDYADVVVPAGLEIEELGDAVAEPVLAESMLADLVETPEAVIATALVETGYEATGELDLAGYTCQDCVYANTCPKVGQASPADCGSFQWRSE